jgi:hypothetical protein
MPANCVHSYGNQISPIARGTINVVGTLTLPTSGVTTFNLGPTTYNQAGIYTLYTFATLAGGTVSSNFAVDGSALVRLGLTAGTAYQDGNNIKVVIS